MKSWGGRRKGMFLWGLAIREGGSSQVWGGATGLRCPFPQIPASVARGNRLSITRFLRG